MPAPTSPEGIAKMDAEARMLIAIRSTADAEEFKTIAIFCGLGLLLSLLAAMSFGLEFGAF
jgi:hypothetical protein